MIQRLRCLLSCHLNTLGSGSLDAGPDLRGGEHAVEEEDGGGKGGGSRSQGGGADAEEGAPEESSVWTGGADTITKLSHYETISSGSLT